MKTGAVVVTHDRKALLQECMQCVLSQTLSFSDVVVVDNASADGSALYLDKLAAQSSSGGPGVTRIHVLHEKENLGGAGGFYCGLEYMGNIGCDLVLIIDDDAMIAPTFMEEIVRNARVEKSVEAFAGVVETAGLIDVSHRRRVSNRFLFIESPVSVDEYVQGSFHCDTATFCGLVVRGEALLREGLPMKDYFLWYDDTEYCLRFSDSGGVEVVTAARLEHKTGNPVSESMQARGVISRIGWRQYYGYRNRYDTALRHFGRRTSWCVLAQYAALYFVTALLKHGSRGAQARYANGVLRDVLHDCRKGRLGFNQKYHW